MHKLNRREFIHFSAIHAALLTGAGHIQWLGKALAQALSGQWVYLNGLYSDPSSFKVVRRIGAVTPIDETRAAYLSFFTETGFEGKINVPFLSHSVLKHPDPRKPFSVIAIPRRAQIAGEIDLSTRKVTQLFYPAPGGSFYGHGEIIRYKNQNFFAVSEVGDDSAWGVITIRSLRDFKIIRTVNSHGHSPHQILLTANGKELLICNSGSKLASAQGEYVGNRFPSSLCLVDIESGKLIRKWDCPTNNEKGFFDGFAHGFTLPSGETVLATKPQEEESDDSGNIYLLDKKSELKKLSLPESLQKRTKGQFLSVAYHEPSHQVFISMPLGHFTVIFSSQNWKYLTHMDFNKSNGISFSTDGKQVYVTNGLGQLITAPVSAPQRFQVINESGKGGTEAHLDRVWMPPLKL